MVYVADEGEIVTGGLFPEATSGQVAGSLEAFRVSWRLEFAAFSVKSMRHDDRK
jgi:hypothetical protein